MTTTYHVQGPDGQVHSFQGPDGATEDQVLAAASAQFGQGQGPAPQQTAPLTSWGRSAAQLGSNLLYGLTGGLDSLVRSGARMNGAQFYSDVDTLPPATDSIPAGAQPSNPWIAPRTPGETYLTAGERGLGAALPFALAGAPEAALPTLASGVGGGLGGEAGHQLAPDSKIAPAIGGLVGALVPGGAATAVSRVGNALTGNLSAAGQDFATAGIPMRSPGLTSDSTLATHWLRPSADTGLAEGDIRNSLGTTAGALGNSVTLQDAGAFAQDRARDWVANVMPKKEAAAWAPVDAKIPSGTLTPLNGFEGVLQSLRGDAGVLQPLRDALTSQVPKRLQTLLNDVFANSPTMPVWSEVRSLRSAIGNAMANPSIVKDIDQQSLKALYAGITDDLKSTAGAQGAASEFDAANAESTRLHSFNDGIVSKLISTKNPAQEAINPEKAASYFLAPGALKRGGSDLEALNVELPDVTRELAAAKVRQMAGLDDAKAMPEKVARSFAAQWETMSPEAKNALVLDLPTRARLDSAYNVARRVASVKPSAGGHVPLQMVAGGGLGAAMATVGSHAFAGTPVNDLIPAAAGEMFGVLAPAAWDASKRGLANSGLAAVYAASRRPELFPGQVPLVGALAGGTQVISGNGQ